MIRYQLTGSRKLYTDRENVDISENEREIKLHVISDLFIMIIGCFSIALIILVIEIISNRMNYKNSLVTRREFLVQPNQNTLNIKGYH